MKKTSNLFVLLLLSIPFVSFSQYNTSTSFNGFQKDNNLINTQPKLNLFKTENTAKTESEGNPKGLYASLFFGTSQLNYNFDGNAIRLSQINYSRINDDSIIAIPNNINASVTPSSDNQKIHLDAGIWLGYVPKFLSFDINDENNLSIGIMSKLGLSFNGGFGGWLGVGPEIMYCHNKLTFNLGYIYGWTGTQRSLGNLQLTGAENIIIQSGNEPIPENFESEASQYRLHNEDSRLMVIASSTTGSIYGRFGYTFSERTGVGLVIGYRNMASSNVRYELWGPYEKIANEDRSPLNGPEINNLKSSFGFNGMFFQITLYEKPLW